MYHFKVKETRFYSNKEQNMQIYSQLYDRSYLIVYF
jgi:hypothetical protein